MENSERTESRNLSTALEDLGNDSMICDCCEREVTPKDQEEMLFDNMNLTLEWKGKWFCNLGCQDNFFQNRN